MKFTHTKSTGYLAESGGSIRSSNALRMKMVSPIGVGMRVMNIVASLWYCDGNLDIQTRLLFRSKVVMDTPFSFACWLKQNLGLAYLLSKSHLCT